MKRNPKHHKVELESSRVKIGFILVIGIIAILVTFALSLMYGTKFYSFNIVWQALSAFNPELTEHQIIQDIRLPRVLGAAMIGAFLALSGAIMQAMTRNPLAEPSLLGVTHGAAFALVLTLALFPTLSIGGTMIASMIGAGLAVSFIFTLAAVSKGGMTPVKLALAGMAMGMFLSSLTSTVGLYFNVAKDMSFWYAGGLSTINWKAVKMLAVAGLIGLIVVTVIARALTLLNLGVEVTKGLGINLRLVRILGVFAVLLLTGSSVSIAGAIGFIGLIVPHICRMLVGNDYRVLLPISAVFGSLLLMLADVGAKMVNPPYETPVGVITAVIGVPFFLYLVRSGRSYTS